MSKTIRIDIFDQSYNLRGALDEDYVQQLAAYVDGKMRAIAEQTRTIDSMRVAVLAALNIADELHALRNRQSDLEGQIRQRTERALDLVEQALKRPA
ncbi:MAG: cell division protein ZapA [Candidatus Acidiferrales bacterium]